MSILTKRVAPPLLCAAALMLPSCAEILEAVWTPPTHDVSKLQEGTYAVEPDHTQILFSVVHFGFTNYYGVLSGASGSLSFTPKNPAAMAITVRIPVSSLATTSKELDEKLKGPDWLDAARYPTVTFASTSVTADGPQTATVAGTLTLHGVSKNVTLHATLNGGGVDPRDGKETLGFQISGQIRRSDFGVSTYIPLVSDAVTLTIAAAFKR